MTTATQIKQDNKIIMAAVGGCVHHWHISQNEQNRFVGVCRKCGEWRDFTKLQLEDRGWRQLFHTKNTPVWIGKQTIGIALSPVLYNGLGLSKVRRF